MKERIKKLREDIGAFDGECGNIHNGELHHYECYNDEDEWGNPMCPIREKQELERALMHSERFESNLQLHLYDHSIGNSGLLEDGNFIYRYRYVKAMFNQLPG
jgi:hypothetical protein